MAERCSADGPSPQEEPQPCPQQGMCKLPGREAGGLFQADTWMAPLLPEPCLCSLWPVPSMSC